MLCLILGKDRYEINEKLESVCDSHPFIKMDEFSFDRDLVASSLESTSLFGGGEKSIFVFENVLENEDIEGLLVDLGQSMNESENFFVLIEGEIDGYTLALFKKVANNVLDLREKVLDDKAGSKGKDKNWGTAQYNVFALADSVGSKSAKAIWIEYEKALMKGASAEELFSRIWGKIKDMQSSQISSPEVLGIHPFVHKKAKLDGKNWGEIEMKKFMSKLIYIYHSARLGKEELELSLEKLILSI